MIATLADRGSPYGTEETGGDRGADSEYQPERDADDEFSIIRGGASGLKK
ncbi:hypothetical protein [Natrinema amylolyticum]|nr:hypothetical protein [Natrinema amylolyticum]